MWWPIFASYRRGIDKQSSGRLRATGAGLCLLLFFWPSLSLGAAFQATGIFPHAIAVADLNHDGHLDLIIPASAERKVTVMLGNGQGGVLANHVYPVGKGPTWVEAADFDGDGNLDWVTSNTGGASLTLYFGDGKGRFHRRQDI
ncbi:MAG: VCBS repeat-containing protein, partial [Nitrospinota bacterium]